MGSTGQVVTGCGHGPGGRPFGAAQRESSDTACRREQLEPLFFDEPFPTEIDGGSTMRVLENFRISQGAAATPD
uniref:Uncharacterized protein n=1 Tax=Oryza rufipogon TaxID=4529 RepID=A0A0E0NSR9_ORYRU